MKDEELKDTPPPVDINYHNIYHHDKERNIKDRHRGR